MKPVVRSFAAKSAVAALALTLSTFSGAAEWAGSPVWVLGRLIDQIQITPSGNIVVNIVPSTEATGNNGCSIGAVRLEFVSNYSESTQGDQLRAVRSMTHASLLAAQAQNRTIDFYIVNCVSGVAYFDRTQG
jgi:hypothetical protein